MQSFYLNMLIYTIVPFRRCIHLFSNDCSAFRKMFEYYKKGTESVNQRWREKEKEQDGKQGCITDYCTQKSKYRETQAQLFKLMSVNRTI